MQAFSPADLLLHHTVTALDTQPGLGLAVGAVRSVDRDHDRYQSCLWAFHADGTPPRQLTFGPGLDSSPRGSPDGRQLAFLSTRAGGATQLYVMSCDGGEARPVGQFELGVVSLRWTHDGGALLATVAQPVDPDVRGRRGGSPAPRSSQAPEVCNRLPYKSDGVGYVLRREIHLFRIDPSTGEAAQLTDGPFDVYGFAPSPDGRFIAYSRSREGRYAHRTDLWVCEHDCNQHRRITDGHATVLQPAWSPNGRSIAFAGSIKEGDGESRLWLLDFNSTRVTPLGPPGLEVADGDSLRWSPDGRHLLLVRAIRGRHEIVCIDAGTGELDTVVDGNRQFAAFASDGEHLYYAVDSPVAPSEVFACTHEGREEAQVSRLNDWWHERTSLVLEARRFDVPDGKGGEETIEGWLMRAAQGDGPQPLLDDVHGGPAAYALLDYGSAAFRQVLCSRGWAVLMLNAVGSSSFGDEYCQRLSGRWGELDLPQHLAALAQLRADEACDDRIAIAGKSYGGYLSSWAIGHTDAYRAAVVMAPVGNIETHYGTSDGGYYADPLYIGTAPVFDRQRARELSPLQHIEKATTPTLFLQGKDDERCPKCQSEELFVSLYRASQTPAELVLYPGEGHSFLSQGTPSCREDAVRRIVDWVTRHIGPPDPLPLPRSESGAAADPALQAATAAG